MPDGGTWVAALGFYNAFGRWGSRTSSELDAAGGAFGGARPLPVLRARAVLGAGWLGLRGEVARVVAQSVRDSSGGALLAEARIGEEAGLHANFHVTERDGVDPLAARALVEAPLEPATGFFAATGWAGGGRISIPIGSRITTRGGAEFDLTGRSLVAALGALELHDPCRCVIVRATAAHRVGREGVDVWLSVDLPRP